MNDHTNWTRPDLTAPPDDLSHERGGWDLHKLAQRKAVPADLLRKLPLLIMKLKLIAEGDPHTVVTMSKQYVDVIVEMLEASHDALSVAPSQDREDALKNAGSTLSNIAFNWAQSPGYVLTKHDCEMLDKCRKAWDAARQAPKEQSE